MKEIFINLIFSNLVRNEACICWDDVLYPFFEKSICVFTNAISEYFIILFGRNKIGNGFIKR